MRVPIIGSFFEKREDAKLAAFEAWMDTVSGGRLSSAGVKVSEETAMRVVAVFACVRLLSETLATLPFFLYERQADGGRDRARAHSLYPILHDLANPEMTAADFRQVMMVNCLLWGSAYAEKVVDRAGDLVGLYPIMSSRVKVERAKNGKLLYKVRLPDGVDKDFPADRIFRLTWLSPNGLTGYQPISLAQDMLGAAVAANDFAAKFFANGAAASGTVEYPDSLSEAAYERFKKDFSGKYGGLGNAHRLIFLEEGMKFTRLSTPPNEAQMLETRKFHVEEVARYFNVPPHMIQDLSRATFSNIEHQSIGFAEYSIRPWAVRWEQSVYRDLLSPAERQIYFAEILLDGLVRGDMKSRYDAYAVGRQWGWLSADDVRVRENMNILPDGQGQIYMVPMNMVPADQILAGAEEDDPVDSVGSASETEENSLNGATDVRAAGGIPVGKRRAAAIRARVVAAQGSVYRDIGARIAKREAADIRKALKKYLGERSQTELSLWLDDYYRSAPAWIIRLVDPVNMTFAETIQELVSAEQGVDVTSKMKEDLRSFVGEFSAAFAARYSSSSRGQLKSIMDRAAADEEAFADLDEKLGDWETVRSDRVARGEPVQLSNAVARNVFAAAGVIRLIWVNTGAKTCPFCEEMDGRVVGIDVPFLSAGDYLEASDGSGLRISGPKLHPPIHDGCVCQLVSE